MKKLDDLLRLFGGPPVNVEAIIRESGIELDKSAQLDKEISGQVERMKGGKYKISAQHSDHYFRKRFTMAHELGHVALHSDLIGDGVDDNAAYRSVAEGNFYNVNITPREETEANQFAARLLMPKALIEQEWAASGDLEDTLGYMAKRFQVSKQAMEIRLKSLGLTN